MVQIYKVSRFYFLLTRIIENFIGNITTNLSARGRVDIPIFSREKVRKWKKYPSIGYIHVGQIQIKISSLFGVGIDISIVTLIMDN